MERNLQSYLLDIAREEAASKEAELHSLRNSLRYRVGGWMLEVLPPGRRTFVILWRLGKLYYTHLRGRRTLGNSSANISLPEEALCSTILVFGSAIPDEVASISGLWHTDSTKLMALRLDSGGRVTTLILRKPACEVLRRLARVKLDGTKVIWWPEASADFDPALVAHVRAHADECRSEVAA